MPFQFLPVNIDRVSIASLDDVLDLSRTAGLVERIRTGAITPPQGLNDLNREDSNVSELTVDLAAELGLLYGSTGSKANRRIFVQDYSKYVDFEEEQQKVRWGVALRFIIDVTVTDSKANLSGIPAITASAEFRFASASARFQVIGLSSADISKTVPVPTSLNVEAHGEYNAALNRIKNEYMYAQGTVVRPSILAIFAEVKKRDEQEYEIALATGWALNRIAEGQTLQRALEGYDKATPGFREAIRATYLDVARNTDVNARPTDEDRARARRLLGDIRVSD
ncbi:MAG TPA: hypothetical protein VHG91_21145 [Longimicrobium sp.]|nr:hypothetical protein [Longimicrobium sp.]